MAETAKMGERSWSGGPYVVALADVDQTHTAVVGGKGAQLGELSRMPGIRVPDGYCVTTNAFKRMLAELPSIEQVRQRGTAWSPHRTLAAALLWRSLS